MVPSGPSTPLGGGQSVPPSLLRSNSGMMGGQGGTVPSQPGFSSLVSPRTQFSNGNMLGNVPNVSALLNQSFGNGGSNSGLSGSGNNQRGGIDSGGAESDHLPVGNGMGFNAPSSYMVNHGSSGQIQGQQYSNASGNQMLSEQQQQHQPHQHSQQLDSHNFQQGQQQMQQFSLPHNTQQVQQQQQQFQTIRGLAVGSVKLEPQVSGDQHGQQQPPQQQLQSMRSLGSVKLEPQHIQNMRNIGSVKMEPQHSEQSLFLHQQQQQQQQQQQFLNMSRQPSQAAAAAQLNLLNQQRLLQLQQHQQQQQLLKAMPHQRPQLSQSFQQQNMALRQSTKPVYEPGTCARRLTHYMYQQQHRPDDNNIEFWRKFVAEYFAPNAKKKWCVSMYGSGRQTTGVFPQDVWQCEICNRKPGRGFATVEVLPVLFKIKYESGTLEELLYVDMPREYQNLSGQIVLDYAKAIQESVFEQLRVVRDGQLRIVFSPDLKICSWEFCARRHEELIPRRLLIPQVSQLAGAAQKYQTATQNAASSLSVPELQNNCNMFAASARQLAKALEVPLVNDLGYTKRYVRCLQISEVVNSMKDLIDHSRETGTGPIESLSKFPRRTSTQSGFQGQTQQLDEQQQQIMTQNSNHDHSSVQAAAMQLSAINGMASVNNNSLNPTSATTSASTIAGLLHQNSINSRQQTTTANNASSPYGANSVQIQSPGSSTTIIPQTPSSTTNNNNNAPQTSQNGVASSTNHIASANSPATMSMQQQPAAALSGEADPSESQSSVQKILQEMLMSNQLNGNNNNNNNNGSMVGVGVGFGNDVKNVGVGVGFGNDVKNVNVNVNVNGMMLTNNNTALKSSGMVGNGVVVNSNIGGGGGGGYGTMGGGLGHSGNINGNINGIRSSIGNNNNSMLNGRVGGGMASMAREQSLNHHHQQQQQDMGSQLLNGLGAVNGFNNLQFDWKASP